MRSKPPVAYPAVCWEWSPSTEETDHISPAYAGKEEKMARKKLFSIRLEPETRSFLERYEKADDNEKSNVNLSAQLREDMQTFQEIVTATERSMNGKFEFNEAMLIVDLLNAYFFTPGQLTSLPYTLEVEVDDGCQLEGLDEKWNVDREALVNKIKALTPMEAYTVFHMSRLVWAKNGEGDFHENVRRIFRCK